MRKFNGDYASDDQISEMTATAISAVPAQPNPSSHGLTLKRPIKLFLEIITTMTVMIGTATMPFKTALQISILIGLILVNPSPNPMIVAAAIIP